MLTTKKVLAAAALIASGAFALPTSHKLCDGFLPENTMKIGVNKRLSMLGQQMDQATFNRVIDRVEKVYAPIIAAKGGRLQIERNWNDGTVNAYAERRGSTYAVAMFGGLARYKTMTEDGFALVVCHELGHHLGGAPKYGASEGDPEWASNEGQSDYWGNLKCMRQVFGSDDNVALMAGKKIDPAVDARCHEQFSDDQDVALCQRTALAGTGLGQLFGDFEGTTVHFDTPDTSRVSRTDDAHPAAQCRLDTYFAGAACNVDRNLEVDDANHVTGSCSFEAGHRIGVTRPQCWFKSPVPAPGFAE